MAVVYLRKKIQSGIFDPAHFGVSPEDVAVYAITPLFERNDEGQCTNIATGFQDYLQKGSDTDYLHRVRRMTFSAVEEELSPYYAQHTSSASNSFGEDLCAAAREHPRASIQNGPDCRWIVIHRPNEDSQDYAGRIEAPVIPLEFLEIRLQEELSASSSAAESLSSLNDILIEHSLYRPAVPLPLVVKALECVRSERRIASAPIEEEK